MFRNQYDTDVTVWSPQGHLYQVDYAKEAVKQGSAALGIRSDKICVLGAIKRSPNELADHQKKLFAVDKHMGMAIAGLTADARTLARFMRTEALNHKFVYGSDMPIGRLVMDVADKCQQSTQSYVRRPYGVGLLVAGFDKTGPHLYQTSPSGDYLEFKAIAIGSRAQAARTYLEKHFESFPNASKDDLVNHAIKALHGCLHGDQELSGANTSIAIVGENDEFSVLDENETQKYLDALELSSSTTADEESKMED